MILAFLGISLNPLTYIASAIGGALGSAVKDLGSFMSNSTQVTIGSRYAALMILSAKITALLGVFVVLFAAARAALTGDLARLGHDLVRVMGAVLAGFVLIQLVPICELVIHALTGAVAATFAASSVQLAGGLATGLGVAGAVGLLTGTTALIAIVLGLVLLAGILMVFIVLVLAQVLVYIAVYFIPLAWVFSPRFGRRLTELAAVMLTTPFIITSILAVGLAVLGDGKSFGTVTEHLIAGGALMIVTAIAPFSLIKLVHQGGDHIAQMRHPVEHGSGGMASASKAVRYSGGGAGGSGGSAVRAAATAGGGPATMAAAALMSVGRRAKAQTSQGASSASSPSTPAAPSPGPTATPRGTPGGAPPPPSSTPPPSGPTATPPPSGPPA